MDILLTTQWKASEGKNAHDGIIDTRHQVFGYPGLYVSDGSSISANVGVNPSLTICALAERTIGLIPQKKELKDEISMKELPVRLWGYWIRQGLQFLLVTGVLVALSFALYLFYK